MGDSKSINYFSIDSVDLKKMAGAESHVFNTFYASQLHITPHHLSAVISRASGHSAMYWINRAVVLRAKVLLHTSGLLTYEIAERLNFANPPAFNNFFKRETGQTPKEYREGM